MVLGIGAWFALNHKNQKRLPDFMGHGFCRSQYRRYWQNIHSRPQGHYSLVGTKIGWIYNGTMPDQRPFSTTAKINVLNIPPAQAVDPIVKKIAGTGIKVEIYDKKNKPMKGVLRWGYYKWRTKEPLWWWKALNNLMLCTYSSFVGSLRVRYLLGDDECATARFWKTREHRRNYGSIPAGEKWIIQTE